MFRKINCQRPKETFFIFNLSLEFIRRNIDCENIKKETRQAKHVQVYDWIPMSRHSTLWMARAFMKFSMQFLSIYRRKHAQREFNHPLSIFQFFNFFLIECLIVAEIRWEIMQENCIDDRWFFCKWLIYFVEIIESELRLYSKQLIQLIQNFNK